jgi:hypothetical protein
LTQQEQETLERELKAKVVELKEKTLAGKEEIVPLFPMDLAVPFVSLFYAVQFAETVEFKDEYIDLGFSIKHFNLMNHKQLALLKPIEGDFYNFQNERGEQAMFQLMIDDNLFNAAFSYVLAIDKMFSLRDMAKGNRKAEPLFEMLTTTSLG